jgi:hypothetical protein
MSTALTLLTQILDVARSRGLDQAKLAHAAGITAETVSRAKSRGTIDLATLDSLARAAGVNLVVKAPATSAFDSASGGARRTSALSDPKWGLAWSNRDAPVVALVRNALLRGSFGAVLEAVVEQGLDAVRAQWADLVASSDPDERPSAPMRRAVDRMLVNIEKGLASAAL